MMMAQVRNHRGNIVWYVLVVVLSVAVAFVIAEVVALSDRANTAEQESDARADAIEILAEDVEILREQVERSGEEPDVPDPDERLDELPDQIEGPRGEQGERGPRGFRGPRGIQGPEGIQGETGDTGAAGESGAVGATGPQGATGEPGSTGPQGEQGEPGPVGPEGAQGPAGEDGNDGQDGRGIVAVTIEGDARECELVVTYTDDTQDRIPVNGLMCVRLSEE